jgi:mono/diheme cytochrome c family protein
MRYEFLNCSPKDFSDRVKRCAVLVLFALSVAAVGCRSVRRGEPIVGPLQSNDPAVQHGKVIFAHRCNSCHPGGEGGLGPGLNDKPLPVFAMKLQVRTGLVGFKVMPSFDRHQIPSEDLDDLMKYIKAIRKQSTPIEQAQR